MNEQTRHYLSISKLRSL